jgi:hypothetical protein
MIQLSTNQLLIEYLRLATPGVGVIANCYVASKCIENIGGET